MSWEYTGKLQVVLRYRGIHSPLSGLKMVMEKGREMRSIFSLGEGAKMEYKTQTHSKSKLL